jgi:integrase
MEGRAALPRVGEVRVGDRPSLPYLVVDAAGEEVEPVSQFLRELTLGDRSTLTVKSYAYGLLRWWRLLDLLGVAWERATTDEVAVLVGWLRSRPNPQRRRSRSDSPPAGSVNVKTGKPSLAAGYAPATINHALSVLSAFYHFHVRRGRGPVINPVPVTSARRSMLAHHNPMHAVPRPPRAPLRQKVPDQPPRAIPDPLWDELFAAMTSHRDRALLALYVSSGARASELLALLIEHVDWAGQRIWVVSKGSRALQAVPASPQALTYLALYLDEVGVPRVGETVWRARRGEARPLTYSAMRRVLQRANHKLGTNWSLHDMRHTAAARLVNDPALTLPEVQTILRHAHLSTTQRYLTPSVEAMFDKLQAHFSRPVPTPRSFPAGYAPEDVAVVFGA